MKTYDRHASQYTWHLLHSLKVIGITCMSMPMKRWWWEHKYNIARIVSWPSGPECTIYIVQGFWGSQRYLVWFVWGEKCLKSNTLLRATSNTTLLILSVRGHWGKIPKKSCFFLFVAPYLIVEGSYCGQCFGLYWIHFSSVKLIFVSVT